MAAKISFQEKTKEYASKYVNCRIYYARLKNYIIKYIVFCGTKRRMHTRFQYPVDHFGDALSTIGSKTRLHASKYSGNNFISTIDL